MGGQTLWCFPKINYEKEELITVPLIAPNIMFGWLNYLDVKTSVV